MIDVEDVAVDLGDTRALDGVSMTVERGEFVGLVGPNGAGKTTLLRTVNGQCDPDAGCVTVDGDDVTGLSSREVSRRVATVHQDTSVRFAFDVETIVAMGRTPHRPRLGGDPDGATHVDRAIERTVVDGLRDRRISEVSGGERQRVFLARALAQDAPGLLLDEPTASLDLNHARRTLSLVRSLADDGHAVLAAIHDLDAAAHYCDRLVVLADGAVVDRGEPAAVLTAEAVERAFDTGAAIARHPVTGSPTVTALPTPADSGRRVHVLGGGPLAGRTINDCWAAGHRVTAGPLTAGDVAVEASSALGVAHVVAPAFESLDAGTRRRCRAAVDAADAVVLTTSASPPVRALAERADHLLVVDEADGPRVAGDRGPLDDVDVGSTLVTTSSIVDAVDRLTTESTAVAADD